MSSAWRARLEARFRFAEHGTTLARDTAAGATTFVVMSYIIFVNPSILGAVTDRSGETLPVQAVAASTCLAAGVMTILMGLFANRAYAIAPGLGLSAVVAFGLVGGAGLGFPEAMGVVVMEGALVTLLVLLGLRERVMTAIPLELKKAIAIGIGLFIAFVGLVNSGLVARGSDTPVTLGSFTTWPIVVALFALVLTVVLRARRVRFDLLAGILAATVLATVINRATGYTAFTDPGVARWPDDALKRPDFSLVGAVSFDSFATIGVVVTLAWVFSLFLADFFDTMGTLVGVGRQAGYLDEQGELPDLRTPLLVDSVAAMAGGAASASSATTYVESGAGVASGGRTGWVSVVTGALFFPFLVLAPLVQMVPPQATGAALVVVGWLLVTTLSESEALAEGKPERTFAVIAFDDLALGFAAALTIMVIPFTYSIATGIGFGFIAYVVIRLAQGEGRTVHPLMLVASAGFVLYFLIPLLQDTFSWV